jgi:hypothetical protein
VLGGGQVSSLTYDEHSGIRISAGGWLDSCQDWGIEASVFTLEHKTDNFGASSPGDPIVGNLFLDTNNRLLTIVQNAQPGVRTGGVAVFPHEQLWGAEVNVRMRTVTFMSQRCDLLFGFRHLQFDENLDILGPSFLIADGAGCTTYDSFGTHNRFYGPQVGLASIFRQDRWSINYAAKLAMGDMHEDISIQGATTFTTPGEPVRIVPGGVLALPTNIGQHSHDEFAVVPEFTIDVGYQVGHHVRVFLGYNILYASSLARPGDQIDFLVNPAQVPSLATFNPAVVAHHPAFVLRTTDFWVQGLNFGVEVRF